MSKWDINLDPLPDQPTEKEFLKAFYQDEREKVYLRTFDDTKNTKESHNPDIDLYNFDSIIPTLKKWNDNNQGIFFVVNGGGQDDKSVIKRGICQAQFMEIDEYSMENQIQLINAFPLKPSIIVKTKKSLHCYWLLNDGRIKQFREIQIKLIDLFGSDPVIKNESRVMRLPGYYHKKQDPVLVEVIHFDPEIRYKQSDLYQVLTDISLKDLLDDTSIDEEDKEYIINSSNNADNNKSNNITNSNNIYEHNRVNTLISCISRMKKSGLSDDEIRERIIDINKNKCIPPLSDKELSAEVLPAISRWQNLNKYHKWSKPNKDGICKPIDVIDNIIAEDIINNNNIFVLFKKLYIYKDGFYKLDDDGSIIKSIISLYIYDDLITDNRLTKIYRLIMSKNIIHIKLSDINKYPSNWIPFKNGMLDVLTFELHSHSPKYRNINIIPHEWKDNIKETDTVVTDFINGIIPDKDDRTMFFQYIGYSFSKATNQQKFLIIKGDGGLGKSVLLSLIQKAIGEDNYSSLTLQNLNDRFSPVFLMGKLMNIYADVPSTDMREINGIKTITGEDMVRAEYKGGDVFQFQPYCKLLYSANRIPKSKDDFTNAYYRRMLIINVDQKGDYIPDLEKRLENNVDVFIHLVISALHDMYVKYTGEIQVSKNSINNVDELYKETDTVHAWLSDCNYIKSTHIKEDRMSLFRKYQLYCQETDRESRTSTNFYACLRNRGFKEQKTNGIYKFYIERDYKKESEEQQYIPPWEDDDYDSNVEEDLPWL